MPIPKPKTGEEKSKYIDRCTSAIVGEYDDPAQAVAVCHSTWKEAKANMTKTYELKTEIFAVGTWNGMPFKEEDVKSIAGAFNTLAENHHVPLKMGHNKKQPFTDGQPALGWVEEVWYEAGKLFAKFTDMPKVVYDAMKAKLYKHVSVELDFGVTYKGDHFPYVLSGVALLGADIPAVNTLSDLQAYMGRELTSEKRVAFTAIETDYSSNRSTNMSDENIKAELSALKIEMSAKDAQIARLTEENVQLKQAHEEQKAQFKVLAATEETRKLGEKRKALLTKLENMVTEKKITPASRDEFMRDFDDAQNKDVITFAVDKLEKTIESNPAYFGAEQARIKALQEREEEDMDPSAVVAQRTNEYMSKHGVKDFSVAKTAVLRADPALADRYTKGGA